MALSFFCRIRPPLQIELLTSAVQKSDRSKSPVNRCRTPIKSKPSSLSQDCMFNIFTCANQRNSKIVIASENPIKSKLIDCYIKSEEDVENYRGSILENIEIFNFDRVFPLSMNQLQLYNETCKENTNQLFKGIDSNIIIYGPNSSGKNYCLRGLENKESGLVIQTVEAILSLIEISKQSGPSPSITTNRDKTATQFIVTTSIVAVINDEAFDLLVPKSKRLAFIDDHSSHSVRFISEFKNLYRTAMNNLKALEKNEIRLKSHLFISIQLNKNEYRENIISKINFIRLGDSDEPELARDFNELANYLKEIKFHCKKERKKDFEGRLFLKYLNENVKENSSNTLLTLVSGNNQLYKQSLRALKFSSNIFDYTKSQKSNVPYDLMKKISFQYNQIENFTNMAKNLSNQQCMDWITDKEYEFFSLEKEINHFEKICKDEEFMKKTQVFYELYSFLKKIKEKAIYQIDNLSNLISKYNTKKNKKQNNSDIPKTKERALSQEIKERDSNIAEDLEKDLHHLKRNIMKKIDETIDNSPIGLASRLNVNENESCEKHEPFEAIHEKKLSFNNNVSEVDLIRTNTKLKKKLKKRKQTISALSEELKFKETKSLEEKLLAENYIRELEEKNLNMKNYIESLETKRTTHEEMNEFQKGYHTGLLKEMKDKIEKENTINEGLKKENERLVERNEILEQNLSKMDKKIKKYIERFEGEKKVLALENQKEMHERQMEFEQILEKLNFQNNELKGSLENEKDDFLERISNLEGFVQKLKDENSDLIKMQSTYLEEVNFLKDELEGIRKSKKELSESLKEKTEKLSHLESKNKEVVKELERVTFEKENLEKLAEEENKYNKELQDKYELLIEESKIEREYNLKLEGEFEYIKHEQNKEFEELAKKLDEFVIENRNIIEENDQIKQNEIELKNEISHLLKDQEKLLFENEKSSNKNDQLKKCLQTMEAKIKEFIEEKKIQVKSSNKFCKENIEYNGDVLLEKLKILEEIEEVLKTQRSPPKFK